MGEGANFMWEKLVTESKIKVAFKESKKLREQNMNQTNDLNA